MLETYGLVTFSLLWGKACILLVRLWVGQIDFLVGDVEIAAENYRLLLVQL